MKGTFPIHKFRELRTPFYYYDTKVLRDTLSCIRTEAARYGNYSVHYAVKANANPKVLAIIRENGLGADCVSGGEIRAAVKAGFPTNKIVYAGVGKTEEELQAEGIPYTVKKLPMAFSSRFVAENEQGNGVCKLILAEDETVIGAHLLGNPASELIVIAGLAIEKGMKAEELKSIVFPHPTVGEIIKEALY